MTKNKRFLSIISVAVLVALIFSLGAFSASAQANNYIDPNDPNNYDIRGNFIPAMMHDFAEHGVDIMTNVMNNCAIDYELSLEGTRIFVDNQLIEYGFIDELVDALGAHGSTTDEKLANLFDDKIYILVYDGLLHFENICATASANPETEGNQYYSFSDAQDMEKISSWIGTTYMCAFGIYQFPYGYGDVLALLEEYWLGLMPIFIIERDHMPRGEGGLPVYILIDCWFSDGFCFVEHGEQLD